MIEMRFPIVRHPFREMDCMVVLDVPSRPSPGVVLATTVLAYDCETRAALQFEVPRTDWYLMLQAARYVTLRQTEVTGEHQAPTIVLPGNTIVRPMRIAFPIVADLVALFVEPVVGDPNNVRIHGATIDGKYLQTYASPPAVASWQRFWFVQIPDVDNRAVARVASMEVFAPQDERE